MRVTLLLLKGECSTRVMVSFGGVMLVVIVPVLFEKLSNLMFSLFVWKPTDIDR